MQGKHHDGAIAVEVRAFIENFVGFHLKLQRGRAWLGQRLLDAARTLPLAWAPVAKSTSSRVITTARCGTSVMIETDVLGEMAGLAGVHEEITGRCLTRMLPTDTPMEKRAQRSFGFDPAGGEASWARRLGNGGNGAGMRRRRGKAACGRARAYTTRPRRSQRREQAARRCV